ncbi:MAG: helix-turn-helix domain-containing protein [Cyanobacteriota bacterium]
MHARSVLEGKRLYCVRWTGPVGRGVSAKAIADLFGLATRTLRRWGLMIRSQGFSRDQRKGTPRHVIHRFSEEEHQQVLSTVNDPRFADLTPGQIVAILAEEGVYVGSESTIYRIMRQEGLLHHRGRSRPPREPREPPVLEATGIHQVLAWDSPIRRLLRVWWQQLTLMVFSLCC